MNKPGTNEFEDFEREELLSLLPEYCDGTMEATAADRFEAILRGSQAARNLYVEYIDLHLALRKRARGFDSRIVLPHASENKSTVSARAFLPSAPITGFLLTLVSRPTASINRPLAWSVLAVGVLFTAYVVAVSWNLLSRNYADEAAVVASIANEVNTQWASSKSGAKSEIRTGELLKVSSGIVELRLTQGATLVVEGPAEWSIDGDNRARLNRGKLVARVPRDAIGFTLETPMAKIIDLGTEFGVEVAQNGDADVHVVKGKVDIAPFNRAGIRSQKLQTGQSLRVTRDTSRLTSDPAIAQKFAGLASPERDEPVPHSQADRYPASVRALDPVVFLRGEHRDGMTLLNDGNGKYVGKFTRSDGPGEVWEKGLFGGEAICFRGKQFSDRLTIEPEDSQDAGKPTFSRGDDPARPFSIVLWARCHPGQNTGTLIGKGEGFKEQFLLDVLEGKFRFVTYSANQKSFPAVWSKSPLDGTWQHVAVVFDPDRPSIAIYVNGQFEAQTPLTDVTLFATDETTYIGGRPFQGDQKKLSLDGALDEIAIFDKALTSEQINSLYKLQTP